MQTLANLKAKLIVLTGTSIGEVLFDWQEYLNEVRTKTYPVVLWSLNNAKFKNDIRTSTIQKVKPLTLNVFAINSFDALTQDKITVWDTLEGYFNIYLNKMNETTGISIENINEIDGEYFPEGLLSVDSELGIGYKITLKIYC
jgi:hypothetical protein